MDDIEFQKHMASTIAEGFALNPSRYERLRVWNFVVHQLWLALALFEMLRDRKVKLGDIPNVTESMGLFHAAVMSYGRCFVGAAPGLLSFDAGKVFANLPEVRKTHDELMDVRNSLIAHTGTSDLIRVTVAVKEESSLVTIRHLTTTQIPGKDDIDRYLIAINAIHSYADERNTRHLKRLAREIGKSIKVE